MIREKLVQEYCHLISDAYPDIGALLNDCYVAIIDGCLNSVSSPYYYLGVYYSGRKSRKIIAYRKELKCMAESFGIIDVVFIDANPLIRDPRSYLKKANPRLWLELYWIATRLETNLD